MKRLFLAITAVAVLTTILAGGAVAQNNGQTNHGSGKDRQGYCLAGDQYVRCPPGTNGTEPEQSHGNFLYGEPGVDRRAYPEPGGGPGCAAASALNSNPSQAAGDNAAWPNQEHAAEPALGGGPFYHCYG